MTSKPDIRAYDDDALKKALVDMGQPAFRSKQIADWIWSKGASTFEEMTNLPQDLRLDLEVGFGLHPIAPEEEQVSRDGTVKCAFPIESPSNFTGLILLQF